MHVLYLLDPSDTKDEVFRVYEVKEDADTEAHTAEQQGYTARVIPAKYFSRVLSDSDLRYTAHNWFA